MFNSKQCRYQILLKITEWLVPMELCDTELPFSQLSAFVENAVTFIDGFVVRMVEGKDICEECRSALRDVGPSNHTAGSTGDERGSAWRGACSLAQRGCLQLPPGPDVGSAL